MQRRNFVVGAAAGLAVVAGAVALWLRRGVSVWGEAVAVLRRPVVRGLGGDPALRELVRMATLAANSHNTQAWRFVLGAGENVILPDFSRRCPVVDPDDHHLFASLGAAAENIVQAAPALGLMATVRFEAAGDGRIVVALQPGPPVVHAMAEAILRRQCTRGLYDGRPVPAEDLRVLVAEAAGDGVEVRLITERPAMDAVAALVIAGNTQQMGDAGFLAELKQWLRFDYASAVDSRDGLFAACSGNPVMPDLVGRAIFDKVVTASGENQKYRAQIAGSAGLCVFVAAQDDRAGWVTAGRAYQRFALQATVLGVRHAFVNQAVEVPAQRSQLAELLKLGGRRPDLVVRFGYGDALPASLRRPVADVLRAATA